MDHATLPAVADAQLPETYERAKNALAECSSIDECKGWADKALALASYARQSKDDSLRKMAERIQARAIRRAGEILKQIEPNPGARTDLQPRDGDDPRSRTQAAEDAGLSDRQRKNALRIAEIPEPEFTEMVEGDNPPTVTKLAEIGTKKKAVDLKGRDPDHFNKALHFLAMFDWHLKKCREHNIESMIDILVDDERARLRNTINKIDLIYDQIMTRI